MLHERTFTLGEISHSNTGHKDTNLGKNTSLAAAITRTKSRLFSEQDCYPLAKLNVPIGRGSIFIQLLFIKRLIFSIYSFILLAHLRHYSVYDVINDVFSFQKESVISMQFLVCLNFNFDFKLFRVFIDLYRFCNRLYR